MSSGDGLHVFSRGLLVPEGAEYSADPFNYPGDVRLVHGLALD